MAKAWIKEFERLQDMPSFPMPVWHEPAFNEQSPVDFTAGETQSAAFGPTTNFIVFTTDSIFSYLVGSDPHATTDNFRLVANPTIVIGVHPGHKISFIQNV